MYKGDRARFSREERGHTFSFVNTRNVKTPIEIMKYSLKVDKNLLIIINKRLLLILLIIN